MNLKRRLFTAILILTAVALTAAGYCATSLSESQQDGVYKQVESLLASHRLEEARAIVEPILKRDANDPRALLFMGRIQAAEGHDTEAQRSFEKVLVFQASSTEARVQLGLVQSRLGLRDDALVSFEEVLRNAPASAEARHGEMQTAVALALEARKSGDQDGALVYLARAMKWVPDDPALLLDFGIQAESLHLFKDSEDALKKSLTLRPGDPGTTYALARVELDEQKTDAAERDFRAYLALRPSDASAHFGLGKLLHMLARIEEAKAELARSIELQAAQTESYYELGQIELEARNDDQASIWLAKVLARNPNHGGALTGMGILRFRAKDFGQAETYLRSAVLYAPEYAPAHHYYGLTLARLGNKELAEAELAAATRIEQEEVKRRGGFALQSGTEPDAR
jgi:tetratricopeptide (TPR) repeat protein